MKALFVSNDPSIFDAASPARVRMRAYAAAIGELHIVSIAKVGAREEHEGGLHLYPVFAPRLWRVRALAQKARALIATHGIEVVSAQDPFEHGLAALRATAGTGAKLHVQVHTDFLSPWFTRRGNMRSPMVAMPLLNRWRVRVAGRVLAQARGIRVVSERIKESLVKAYGARIVEPVVIPIQVSNEVPMPVLLPPRPFTYTLIAIGRVEPEKRIEDILAALVLVIPHYPMVGLVVVGDGRERPRLERMARRLRLADHVLFLGNRPDARGLLHSAQAFIQASAYEGYGRTLVEAALARVPIITTDVGIVGEVFKGYEDVLAVPVADPTALSLSIVGLIEDTGAALSLRMHAEAAVAAHLAAAGDTTARIALDLAQTIAKV
jgi:glycosyltransferase involved in cell wall biosynthesis